MMLLALTMASVFTEVISLGAVVPFIGILTEPDRVFAAPWVRHLAGTFGIMRAHDLVVPLAVGFAIAALVAGAVRLLLLWASTHLANSTGADLSVDVYRRTLYQPYQVHVARSSSEIIGGITMKVATATGVLASLASVATSAALVPAILITLIVIDPVVATIALFVFSLSYAFTAWRTRKRFWRNSIVIAREQTQVVKALQEGLGAIRDVLLDGTQTVYSDVYRRAIYPLQHSSADNVFLISAPRYVMEALGMVLISALTVVMSRRPGGVGAALPVLGALAFGAQRLLPLMQQLYNNWSTIASSQASLIDVLDLLDQPLPAETDRSSIVPIDLQESITFDDVHFRYSADGPWVLRGIKVNIPKGARVGFVGTTGSGKSTALDLLMALLEPTKGRILADGVEIGTDSRSAWQKTIAHVPQSIFLADTTIAENIAFGIPRDKIDLDRVRSCARQAQLADFIESGASGYDAVVGERGVRLSGGQRQRIGIARALYKEAQVLVFDEATSALDGATEAAVMSSIEHLNRELTIVIVAHRLSTLRHCDTVISLEHGRVAAQGSYAEMIRHDASLQEPARNSA